MPRIQNNEKILFMGDSITDCDRHTVAPPLGGGYVQFVHCFFVARYPDLEVEFVNRGIAGETIHDLEARWEQDVIAEKPDWLFIMIGVNDVLFRFLEDQKARSVSDEEYLEAYRRILRRTREALDCKIVLMEPSPLEENIKAESHQYMRNICNLIHQVAGEFDTEVIPIFQRMYDSMVKAPAKGWMIDVPHPNPKGHGIMALSVLEHLDW